MNLIMISLFLFKNYFKNFIYLFLFIFFHLNIVYAQSELPKCKGKDYTKYKNCFATYLNKDISKDFDGNDKWTQDFTGEFGSVAGVREGKGSSTTYKNGKFETSFVGEYINDKAEGAGVLTWKDGVEYVGQWKNGLKHGQGTFTTLKAKYVGEWKDNMLDGLVVVTFFNGSEYVGEYKKHMRNGQGTFKYNNGNKYVGEWKDDLTHGVGTYTNSDGQIYTGEFKDGKYHGQGSVLTADKRKYVGQWKNDLQHGKGTFTWLDGQEYVGEWKDGEYHGQGKMRYSNGDTYDGQWKNNLQNGQGTFTYKIGVTQIGEWKDGAFIGQTAQKKLEKEENNIDLNKERKKLEEELKKLEEEKNKAKKAADKKKNIKKEIEKYYTEAYDFADSRSLEYAQQFIKDLQAFIKSNSKEFDILEVTELMIDNKYALEGLWNSEHEESFDSLWEFAMKSKSFEEYYFNVFFDRVNVLVKKYNSEVKSVEDNIDFLKKYLQENLTSKANEKIVLHIRKMEKVFNDPTFENLKKINKETNQFIKSLGNKKKIKKQKKKVEKKTNKYQSISEKKSSIKGSPKEKIINILKELEVSYREIKFSRSEKDFIIYNLEIYDQKIEKIEVDGLNEIYLEGFFKSLIKSEETDLFNSYNGKYFDEIKISGINNLTFGNIKISGKEIVISNLDFKKFDIIKKLINPPKGIQEYDKRIISYMISASFDLYFVDIISEDLKTGDTYEYDYVEILGFKDLSINKFLIKNAIFKYGSEIQNIKEVLLEKLILDKAEILAFLNSDEYDSRFPPQEYFSYIQNGMKSLRKFEINEFSLITKNERILDFDNFQFNNIKFDYLGDNGDKKIPISFEFIVDGADFNLKNAHEYRDIADSLKYKAIKFDFGGEWDWNTRRNNLSINLDLGIKDAASIELKSSFTGLSTEVLNLTGGPLATYLMTEPKLKSLNLALDDNSLKNRLIYYFAKQENMSSEQYKDFIVQSIQIFIKTIGANNTLVKSMEEAVTNFIYDANNITLSAKPSQPLSITDLIPDFRDPDPNKIIDKLNLKITNSLF